MRYLLMSASISIAVTATFAHASPLYFVQAQTQARVENNIASPDTGQVQAISVTTGLVGFDLNDATGIHSAHITATAAEGHLYGSADAFSHFVNLPVTADATTLLLRFFDTITVNSATLAPGTPVNILATMALTDTLTSQIATCCANADGSGMGMAVGDQAGPGVTISHTVIQHAPLIWLVGSANLFAGSLAFDTGSSAGVSPAQTGDSTAMADLQFFLDPVDPSVALTSASGASYASPAEAPEPATLGLLLLGLAGVALGQRRVAHARVQYRVETHPGPVRRQE